MQAAGFSSRRASSYGFDKVAASGLESVSRPALRAARWRSRGSPRRRRRSATLRPAGRTTPDRRRTRRRVDRGFRSSPIGMPSRPVRAGHRVVRLRLRPKPGHRHRAPAYVRTRPAGCTPASPAPASATAACPATTSTSAPKAATFSPRRPRSALSPTGSSSGSAATAAWTGPQSPGSQRHQQEPERRSTQAAT